MTLRATIVAPFAFLGAAFLGAAPASAGEIDVQAGVDFFRADSVSGAPDAGSPVRIGAQEMGLNGRVRLSEFDDRLKFRLDYRGRVPLPGEISNRERHLIYDGQVSYDVIKDLWTVGVGRFVAPTGTFLLIDGGWTEVRLPLNISLKAFGGRRGVSGSLRNLDWERFLPAVGGAVGFKLDPYVRAEIVGSWAEDSSLFQVQGKQDIRRRSSSANVRATVTSRPIKGLFLGLNGMFAQQARFLLGPTWGAGEINVQAVDFVTAYAYVEYRPLDWIRGGYDVHFQKPAAFAVGATNGLTPDIIEPEFLDNRFRLAVAPLKLGWLRASFRHRLRNERQEFRTMLQVEANELYLPGLYARGRIAFEDVVHDGDAASSADLNRLLWSASLGYDRFGFDIEAGASFMDRAAPLVSGRQATNNAPESPVDLAPFTLEAQRVFFVRAFYNNEWFFAGADFERSLEDNEFRFMLQGGAYWSTHW